MSYFTKRYHPPGTPAGTLKTSPGTHTLPLKIRLIDFTKSDYSEKDITNVEECVAYLKQESVTWIHIQGSCDAHTLDQFGQVFGLHPLALEDVMNQGQRPKVETYDDQLFVILSLPRVENDTINIEQISFFLGRNYVISFHESERDPFGTIISALRKQDTRIRTKAADFLLYTLLDLVVDECFPLLESIGNDIEDLEEELINQPTQSTLENIHTMKRELLLLRRMLWPQRELFGKIQRDGFGLIADGTMLFLRDCYDHTIQIMELLESYRETTSNMLDVYLSSVSQRLNETMKTLTIIATIFMPLTFIVGVYGMNFSVNEQSPWAMPELRWYYGYPLVWIILIITGLGMWLFFKRKRWW